jgi:hypothetical protein
VCGTKNFVSMRLYSAPQSHWTIVAIFGVCAFGELVQAGSFVAIKSDPLPGLGAQTSTERQVAGSVWMHFGLLMKPTYVNGNDVDVNEFKREVSAEPDDVCLRDAGSTGRRNTGINQRGELVCSFGGSVFLPQRRAMSRGRSVFEHISAPPAPGSRP